jgi:ADP-heptose:LPS heptosyltransferase
MKIALIRLDKIGDLVSTLPVDQVPELKGHEIRWVIAEGLGFLAKRADPPRDCLELSLVDTSDAQKKLRKFLDEWKPDLAVFFYGPWWVSKVLWQASVPRRFGRRSQWHSYVFLNGGLRQSRSEGAKHEADYNLELVLAALKGPSGVAEVAGGRTAPVLTLTAPTLRHLYEKFELRSQEYFVVHPGMAGSALNWPTKHYVSLIEKLKNEKEVVVTGTAADEKWIAPIRAKFEQDSRVQILQGQLSIDELLFILQNSAGVVAPSTGVLHLAAALGARAVGLYSPIPSQHPRRWGPRGPRSRFLLPDASTEGLSDLSATSPNQVIECLKSL